MSFFTYFYLENKMYFHDYLKYIVIFVTLGTLLLASTLYLRHRIESKYRDLSIISYYLLFYYLVFNILNMSKIKPMPMIVHESLHS